MNNNDIQGARCHVKQQRYGRSSQNERGPMVRAISRDASETKMTICLNIRGELQYLKGNWCKQGRKVNVGQLGRTRFELRESRDGAHNDGACQTGMRVSERCLLFHTPNMIPTATAKRSSTETCSCECSRLQKVRSK